MRVYPTFVLVVYLAVPSAGSHRHERTGLVTDAIHDPTARFALERAVKMAADRLERPECRKVLSDFRDAFGRRIQERLDALGDTPRQYLTRLTFREALESPAGTPRAWLLLSSGSATCSSAVHGSGRPTASTHHTSRRSSSTR